MNPRKHSAAIIAIALVFLFHACVGNVIRAEGARANRPTSVSSGDSDVAGVISFRHNVSHLAKVRLRANSQSQAFRPMHDLQGVLALSQDRATFALGKLDQARNVADPIHLTLRAHETRGTPSVIASEV